MNLVWAISGAILLIAALVVTVRTILGPSTLDRLVAMDTTVALAMCGLAVWVAASGNTTVIPGIIALSLFSFIGSVAVARFRVRDDQT